jgi:hypothetical protein
MLTVKLSTYNSIFNCLTEILGWVSKGSDEIRGILDFVWR